jgi:endonuclease/exonuclease/phosphatase family metal-dependent hydrolase
MSRALLVCVALGACSPVEKDADSAQPFGSSSTQTHTTGTHGNDVAGPTLRVVTWNLELVGSSNSEQYLAAAEILARINADVVALNEINEGESGVLTRMAGDLGYNFVEVPSGNPFGDIRNAILTRLPVNDTTTWRSDMLSGDDSANDMTRWPVEVEVVFSDMPVRILVQHFKSGGSSGDMFRRMVDGQRIAQAAATGTPSPYVIVGGDFNAEVEDAVSSPGTWYSVPGGLPSSFSLGSDLEAELDKGLPNTVFSALQDAGYTDLPATQPDGRDATRDVSQRRLDYLFVSPELQADTHIVAEVYDARDDANSAFIWSGEAPYREATQDASDHFPVVADFLFPAR